jgi:hypothetical protein
VVFRDPSPLARKHPSTYLPGDPRDATARPVRTVEDDAYARDQEVRRALLGP